MSQLGVPYRYAAAESRRGVRLLGPHVVGLGAGRRLPAAPIPAQYGSVAARAGDGGPARRPDLLLRPISHVGIYLGDGS